VEKRYNKGDFMTRGWLVTLNDGTVMKESDYDWREIPKNQIKELSLLFDGRRWDLSGKEAYFVRNTASVVPGAPQSFRVEKRSIGYYEGREKISYMLNELTGECKIVVD
jgi:hypothetical protein